MELASLRAEVPRAIYESLEARGISKLTPPQAMAVQKGLLKGKNMVVSSPTASGKTIVAELACANTILSKGRRAVYIAPMRALASEKFAEFREAYPYVKSVLSIGDLDSGDKWLSGFQMMFFSTEKFDSLMRHGIDWLREVGCFVFDEVHMMGDVSRGPTLELLITKLRASSEAQMIALSATIGNASEIAEWMGAELVESDYRPVKLDKGIIHDGVFHYHDGKKEIEQRLMGESEIPEIRVIEDTLARGKQAIVFYSTRRSAELGAARVAKHVNSLLSEPEKVDLVQLGKQVSSVLDRPTEQCVKLGSLVEKGVAFHHAGLLNQQRGMIEKAFKDNRIKVICSTTTLCLPQGEEIICNFEPKRIESLKQTDMVLTHNGGHKNVIAPLKRSYKGKIIEITTYGQLPMKMTPEHKVLIVKRKRHNNHYADGTHEYWYDYSKPGWIKAEDVEKGDMVLFPRIKTNTYKAAIKLHKLGPGINQTGTFGKHWARINTDSLAIDNDTLEILGLFIAEGITGKNGIVRFAISTKEEYLTSKITEWFSRLSIPANVKDFERHRRAITGCSKQLAGTLRELFGTNSYNKHIPKQLMSLPNGSLLRLVRGMWLGDGCLWSSKRSGNVAEYITVSVTLAKQLFIALVKLGYMPSLSFRKPQNDGIDKYGLGIVNHAPYYRVRISGKQLIKFSEEVLNKQIKFNGNRTYNIGKIDKNFYYMPVRAIKKGDYSGYVYNLEVEEDSSYVGSFIVHNSVGINMPAHTVLVRDITRFDGNYSEQIGINEVLQLFGRAGRPKYDTEGRAMLPSSTKYSIPDLKRKYITAEPEPINSSLGIAPVLRSHLLAFVAERYLNTAKSIESFMDGTLYGKQFGNKAYMSMIIGKILDDLERWEFVEQIGDIYKATRLGERVSELYIDPMSARLMLDAMKKVENTFDILLMLCNTLEMRPHVRAAKEAEERYSAYIAGGSEVPFYAYSDMNYADYDPVKVFSTAMMLEDWTNELREPEIVKKYSSTPGALYTKLTNADWIIYSASELAGIIGIPKANIIKARVRLRYGIKEELLDLVRLEQVGRARARLLFINGIKRASEITKNKERVIQLLGKEVAQKVFNQLE
ncbi:MAG: DEAD/DEAH box helicase [Candidatus Micrarchaeota archaeon]|nr:DEAD/DEAH box helicase [Candidatus Micrarchaeota archaeon]